MRLNLALLCLIAACGCARTDETDPDPVPQQNGYNMIDPVVDPVAQDPGDATAGAWTRSGGEGAPALVYRVAGGDAALALRCDERDGLVIERHGLVALDASEMMDIQIGSDTGSYAVRPLQPGSNVLRAVIPPADPLMETLATASGPMSVTYGDGAPLVVPIGDQVSQLVVACRAN